MEPIKFPANAVLRLETKMPSIKAETQDSNLRSQNHV